LSRQPTTATPPAGDARDDARPGPHRRVPGYRALAEAITEKVLAGEMRAGDPLPTEMELCEAFGVNRSTVREAIRVLEEARLLHRESAKRLVVSHPSTEDMGQQFERVLRLQEISFEELFEAVSVVEPPLIRLAASRRTPAQLEELAALVARIEALVAEGEPPTELNAEFSNVIARMSGNRALILAHGQLNGRSYRRFQTFVFEHVAVAGQRLLVARRAILAALRAGDADEAERWMLRQIRDFRRGYEMALAAGAAPAAARRAAP
jgi:GntR family transcriptional repressor for pyruvate dehydrogenase complex